MTSTSKLGLFVTTKVVYAPPYIPAWLALKIGAVCALVPLLLWLAGMMWRMR